MNGRCRAIGAILAAHLETFKLLNLFPVWKSFWEKWPGHVSYTMESFCKGKLVDLAVVQIVSASWAETLRNDPRSCCLEYGDNSTKNL